MKRWLFRRALKRHVRKWRKRGWKVVAWDWSPSVGEVALMEREEA